jgi:hypothetical protein
VVPFFFYPKFEEVRQNKTPPMRQAGMLRPRGQADRRSKAKTIVKKGEGDRGDQAKR